MHFFFDIEIPKSITQDAPYEEILTLTEGVITRVEITIPYGHWGLAHLQLLYHEFQLYPLSHEEDYHGDGQPIAFDEDQAIDVNPYELKARGWNLDDTFAHSFLVAITMQRREKVTQAPVTTTLEDLQALAGSEVTL